MTYDFLGAYHPWRLGGSQLGLGKGHNKNFQAGVEEPLGTSFY